MERPTDIGARGQASASPEALYISKRDDMKSEELEVNVVPPAISAIDSLGILSHPCSLVSVRRSVGGEPKTAKK